MRPELTDKEIHAAVAEAQRWFGDRIKQKGKGSFISLHEIRGSIDEEFDELMDALHRKNTEDIVHELKDLYVASLFGLACIKSFKLWQEIK